MRETKIKLKLIFSKINLRSEMNQLDCAYCLIDNGVDINFRELITSNFTIQV